MTRIQEAANRYAQYLSAEISEEISPHDDMYAVGQEGAMSHYMSVGRSAIDVVVSALVAAGNPAVGTILDLPCGGGRVTRHLRALFPEAEIFVSDLNTQKEDFVADCMSVRKAEPNPDFVNDAARLYDLIFVGSLVTHLDADKFERATKWFISALAPKGLLVLTTHGRRHDYMQRKLLQWIDPARWNGAHKNYKMTGFGYVSCPDDDGYGLNISSPSWTLKLVENEPGTRIVGFHEAGWDYHQDVLVVQKHDLEIPT